MGINIDLIKFSNLKKLKKDIVNVLGIENNSKNINDIQRILDKFGYAINNEYIILNNEYYEDGNPYYNISKCIYKFFNKNEENEEEFDENDEDDEDDEGIDLFDKVFCNYNDKTRTELISYAEVYEVLEDLKGEK